MSNLPRLDLRKGVTDPVVILISRQKVEEGDLQTLLDRLKAFCLTREDVAKYQAQMILQVDGYDSDPRELTDIPEVRALLRRLADEWPYWAYFLNQVDDSLPLLASCAVGEEFLGGGRVVPNPARLDRFLKRGFAGMNELFDRFDLPEQQNEELSRGLFEALGLD